MPGVTRRIGGSGHLQAEWRSTAKSELSSWRSINYAGFADAVT